MINKDVAVFRIKQGGQHMTFEQRIERSEGLSQRDIQGNSILGRRNSHRGLNAWHVHEIVWLEQMERRSER